MKNEMLIIAFCAPIWAKRVVKYIGYNHKPNNLKKGSNRINIVKKMW